MATDRLFIFSVRKERKQQITVLYIMETVCLQGAARGGKGKDKKKESRVCIEVSF